MKLIFTFLFSFLIISQSHAIGHVSNVKVAKIRVDLDGRAMIFFSESIGGTPASCVHDAYKSAFGVDAATDGGKAVLSMALTAKTTGSLVTVYGMGGCGIYGGTVVETWNHGFIQ